MLVRLLSQVLYGRRARARAAQQSNDWLQDAYASQQAGEKDRAQAMCRRGLESFPDNVDGHFLLGSLLGEAGILDEAALHLERALALRPGFAAAHAALGNVHLSRNDTGAALASYREAIRLDGGNATLYSNLGLLHQASGRHGEALLEFERAYELEPQLPQLIRNLTVTRLELGEHGAALQLLDSRLRLQPSDPEALKCKGYVLQKMHQPQRALECYECALAGGNVDAELLNNLGIVFQDLGRLRRAIECYDAALSDKPDFPLARWHRSLAYLLQHDFARGWPDYELRSLSQDYPRRAGTLPKWEGETLSGRAILVYGEQGLGDEIMFASCLPDVIAMSRRCVIECSPKLESLFRRSFPTAIVYSKQSDLAQPVEAKVDVDVEVGIGSLPLHLRRDLADFPQHRGYLRADRQRVAKWCGRLASLGTGAKIGISWQGGTLKTRRQVRSLPLSAWLPILRVPDVSFVSLQYTDCTSELAQLAAETGIRIHDWPEARHDYDDTAALVSALDLVISVCTAVVHLSGALGKPVWVMAPHSPEWRYGINADSMPWYPSSRVLRQPEYGQWTPVIDRVAHDLRLSSRLGVARDSHSA